MRFMEASLGAGTPAGALMSLMGGLSTPQVAAGSGSPAIEGAQSCVLV
jgi:hypothetical protein